MKGGIGIMRKEVACHAEHTDSAEPVCPCVCPCVLIATSQSQECVTPAGGLKFSFLGQENSLQGNLHPKSGF